MLYYCVNNTYNLLKEVYIDEKNFNYRRYARWK